MRTTTLGIAMTGACAAALAVTAVASAVSTSVAVVDRFGPTRVELDDSAGPTTITDDLDADTFQVPALSATAQLRAAATARRARLGFDVFGFGSFASRIGAPLAAGSAYRITRNHRSSAVGADALLLSEGDYVQWSPLPFAAFSRPELSLRAGTDVLAAGDVLRVRVLRHDVATGRAVPTRGARVRLGGRSAVTNRNGAARVTAGPPGATQVEATLPGTVKTPAYGICVFGSDPTACGLLPDGPVDLIAPSSTVTAPDGDRPVRGLCGTAGPDRSGVAGVEVALARRAGLRCSFLNDAGRFTGPRRCTDRIYLDARTSGRSWTLPLGRTLAAGTYRAWSRATDRAGNHQKGSIPGVNDVRFVVA